MPGLQATLSRWWLRLCFYRLPSAAPYFSIFYICIPFKSLSLTPLLLPAVLLYLSHPSELRPPPSTPACSLLSISSSSFSHLLGVCKLVSPDPMSGPSWSLLRFRIHDLALGEAKDTEINQSGFSDTSWTGWALGHKMVRAQCPFQHPSVLNVYPQNIQWTKVRSYQSWAWHSSGDDHKGSIFLRKDHIPAFLLIAFFSKF